MIAQLSEHSKLQQTELTAAECVSELDDAFKNLKLDELDQMISDLTKMKARNDFLKNSIESEKKFGDKCFPPVYLIIGNFIRYHVAPHINHPQAEYFVQEVRVKSAKSDLICPIAMKMFKLLPENQKKSLKIANVMDLAKFIAQLIPENDIFEVIAVENPGTIQINIRPEYVKQSINKIVKFGILPPSYPENKETVLIDMSSPNIAKEMHVGHLRSTMIGEALAKLFSFCGAEVHKINHIGDWGTQFGMLIALIKMKHLTAEKMPPITELQVMYKKGKQLFDSDPEFAKESLACVKKLQSKEPQALGIWKKVIEASMNKFEKIYKQLRVENLVTCGESFYQDKMEDLVKELANRNLTEIDEKNRTVMFVPGLEGPPLILAKSDGAFTYDTSDLAALKYRVEHLKADKVIYVVDAGQGPHLKAIYHAAAKIGIIKEEDLNSKVAHVDFGLVLGEDKKKLKTRSGDSIKLQDLIDESVEKAYQNVVAKQGEEIVRENPQFWKDIASKMGIGGLVYNDLCQRRHLDYVFSFDRMLSDKGNTAVYMLYAFVRIQSIIRKCQEQDKTIMEKLQNLTDTPELTDAICENAQSIKLAKQLVVYSQVLHFSRELNQLNNMCDYIYNVATCFSDFYNACRIIDDSKINLSRLALCKATADVIENFLHILGISVISKM